MSNKLQLRVQSITASAGKLAKHISDYGKDTSTRTHVTLAKSEARDLLRKVKELVELLDQHRPTKD
jgi:ribosomal protein S15P/S13E